MNEIKGPGGPFMTAREKGASAAADVVVTLMFKSKRAALHANPGVAGLLRYMTVFGAPAS